MVVYIQKRLNIFVCITKGSGSRGGRSGVYGEPATVSDMSHQAPLRAISGYAPADRHVGSRNVALPGQMLFYYNVTRFTKSTVGLFSDGCNSDVTATRNDFAHTHCYTL